MSNEVTIDVMNEVIARFMGGVQQVIPKGGLHGYKEGTVLWMYLFSGNADPVRSLEYHTSWDWMMPVVEKIESLGNDVRIYTGHTTITNNGRPICQIIEQSKISATYNAVYQFITWYSQQKQTNAESKI